MASVQVERAVSVGDVACALLLRTAHAHGLEALTVVHRQDFTRRIGGVRIVSRGTPREGAHLAAGMTWKSAAAGVGVDGMKCLVTAAEGCAEEALVHALQEHMAAACQVDGGVTFGPDLGCPSALLGRVAARSELLPHLTGLPAQLGGLDINGLGLTAHGVHEAVRTAWHGPPGRALVQGFGAVGGYLAGLLHEDGWRIVGVSNRLGTLADPAGLPVPALQAAWCEGGDGAVLERGRGRRGAPRWHPDPGHLLTLPADLLVPAARTAVCALPEELQRVRAGENPDAMDVGGVLRATGVRMVAEAANHPLTAGAEGWLAAAGVTVLPDVLVNCGGFVGCWVEWARRNGAAWSARSGARELPETAGPEAVARHCVAYTRRTVRENVRAFLAAPGHPRAVVDALVTRRRERLLLDAAAQATPGRA